MRPSSHSDDFTYFVKFATDEEAKKGHAVLRNLLDDMEKHSKDYDTDWDPDDAKLEINGTTVTFEVNTAGYLSSVEATLNKMNIANLKCHQNYQEFSISLVLPVEVGESILPLLLDGEDLDLVEWLNKACDPPTKESRDDKYRITWHYAGDSTADADDRTVWTHNGEINLTGKDYWELYEC
jgi:hypothetical protein